MKIYNNIKNVITLIGDESLIDTIINESMIEHIDYVKKQFSFNTFAPMPDELKYTSTIQEVVSDEDYERIKYNHMVRMSRGEITEHDIIPISYTMQKTLIQKYGHDNWEDWAMYNWGTSNDSYDSEVISKNCFSFYTLNATPHSAIIKMSMKYRNIKFIIKYADEDIGYNVGEYVLLNGETIDVTFYDDFNKDSFILAYKIIGDEYFVRELIYYLDSQEINDAILNIDTYFNSIFLAILELEIVDDKYPHEVNRFLMEKALENEQYEYAAKLQPILALTIDSK
jgi:hypothetical protein